jgi:hypothetical protein
MAGHAYSILLPMYREAGAVLYYVRIIYIIIPDGGVQYNTVQ